MKKTSVRIEEACTILEKASVIIEKAIKKLENSGVF
jgi:hypothetical protein